MGFIAKHTGQIQEKKKKQQPKTDLESPTGAQILTASCHLVPLRNSKITLVPFQPQLNYIT